MDDLFRVDRDRSGAISALELQEALKNGTRYILAISVKLNTHPD